MICCWWCNNDLMTEKPSIGCCDAEHWQTYSKRLEDKIVNLEKQLEMSDDDRDYVDMYNTISSLDPIRDYKCKGCGKKYKVPYTLVYANCSCGHRAKLRHFGASCLDDLLDATQTFLGTKRIAQLAWLAEIIARGNCCYTIEEARSMINKEMDRWEMTENGWKEKLTK